jgi:hypothetical protein
VAAYVEMPRVGAGVRRSVVRQSATAADTEHVGGASPERATGYKPNGMSARCRNQARRSVTVMDSATARSAPHARSQSKASPARWLDGSMNNGNAKT